MRKILSLVMVMVFVMAMAAPVFADPWEKFSGGVEKFIKSPVQIVDNLSSEYEAAEFKPFGVIGGVLKGLFYTVWDAGSGIVDIFTFPVDFESN